MLEMNQLTNLDEAERDLKNKKIILDTAIDIQATLRILVDKGIITREEVESYREQVRNSPKYNGMYLYIQQTQDEINMYRKDPSLLLKVMMDAKLKGK